LEDTAVVRELEVGFFQLGVVVVSGDDVAKFVTKFEIYAKKWFGKHFELVNGSYS
jgi:hypothetical protein